MEPDDFDNLDDWMEACLADGNDEDACQTLWDESRMRGEMGGPNGQIAQKEHTERRSAPMEIRAKGKRLSGYAATFNTEARINDFVESIAHGAFTKSLAGDVVALADHDVTRVLARTRSKTLVLSEDSHGLHFDLSVPATSFGRDVLALVERGDVGGMSFGFTVPKGGDSWDGSRRTLTNINLREISVVSAWPAYEGTVVSARARQPLTSALHRLALARRYLETL